MLFRSTSAARTFSSRSDEVCPAKKDRGVIHVVDRRTDEEIAPDPEGDGTLSVDW